MLSPDHTHIFKVESGLSKKVIAVRSITPADHTSALWHPPGALQAGTLIDLAASNYWGSVNSRVNKCP